MSMTTFDTGLAEINTGIAVEEADPAEVRRVLDVRARGWLGISGDEFLHNLEAGVYDGQDTVGIQLLVSIAAQLD